MDTETGAARRRERAAERGVTLLELMVAITIFAIVAAGVYTTFRTGMRAYEMGIHTGETMQLGRFALESVARDLRSVYYMPETQYNTAYRQNLERVQQLFNQAEEQFVDPEVLENSVNQFNRTATGVDLTFTGGGTEDAATLSLVRHQSMATARGYLPMRLARVNYSLSQDGLARVEENVLKEPLDYSGEPVEKEPPPPELIAPGVVAFDLTYGYYYDGEWRESKTWTSETRSARSDQVDIALQVDPVIRNLQPWLDNWEKDQYGDNLPSYVRVKIVIQDERRKGRLLTFDETVCVPNAVESHVPLPDYLKSTDEEGREVAVPRGAVTINTNRPARINRFGLRNEDERPRTGSEEPPDNLADFILR